MFIKVPKNTMYSIIIKIFFTIIFFTISLLFFLAIIQYPGEWYIYTFFSLAFNSLLYFGFRKNKIFFDTFIGLFFWLGYWLKLSFRIAFMDGNFNEPIGTYFDYSGPAYDQALLVATCGACALLFASYLRDKYIFRYTDEKPLDGMEGIFYFYKNNKKILWFAFILLILLVSVTNALFGIYQRGTVPRLILPFKLGGVYTWLLLFGFASISSLIIDFELRLNNKPTYGSILLAFFEAFFSNVSMLSRGMILNVGALAIGTSESIKRQNFKVTFRKGLIIGILFIFIFGISVIAVNHVRYFGFKPTEISERSVAETVSHSTFRIWRVIIDRWVGIEGVIAISSYPNLGWELWKEAWSETYSHKGTSFYDIEIASSVYNQMDFEKHHHISLPGIIAFFYYPGSYIFLFSGILLVGIFAAALELFVFRLCDFNYIVTSLLAQVVASRYAHFGYVPSQSYLLFGTIVLNVILIFFANMSLKYYYGLNERSGISFSKNDSDTI